MTNYADLRFSDKEVLTIFLFGVIKKQKTLKAIYQYTNDHMKDWFPRLPSYVAFIQRLNKVSDVFIPLINCIENQRRSNNKGTIKHLEAKARLLSKAISSIRQPIESFFNWLEEKTSIQIASKVRSYKGLMVHVFGRIAAAFMLMFFEPFSS